MIRITRKWQMANAADAYKIYIDGIYCGEIRANDGTKDFEDEIIEFEVGNGCHVVCAKMSWHKSNELCVDVNDSIVDIEVGCLATGWRVFFWPVYRIFRPHEYLWLKVKEAVDTPTAPPTA